MKKYTNKSTKATKRLKSVVEGLHWDKNPFYDTYEHYDNSLIQYPINRKKIKPLKNKNFYWMLK